MRSLCSLLLLFTLLGGAVRAQPTDVLDAIRAAHGSDAALLEVFGGLAAGPDRTLTRADLQWLSDRFPAPADARSGAALEALLARTERLAKVGTSLEWTLSEETRIDLGRAELILAPQVRGALERTDTGVRIASLEGVRAQRGIATVRVIELELYRTPGGEARARVTVVFLGRRTIDVPLTPPPPSPAPESGARVRLGLTRALGSVSGPKAALGRERRLGPKKRLCRKGRLSIKPRPRVKPRLPRSKLKPVRPDRRPKVKPKPHPGRGDCPPRIEPKPFPRRPAPRGPTRRAKVNLPLGD